MCPNPDVGSTEQELINISEHKIYKFDIHWWVISQRRSHSIIWFIVVRSREERPKLSVSVSGSRSPQVTLSISINQLVHFGLISTDNMSLEDPVWSKSSLRQRKRCPRTSSVMLSSITTIEFLFLIRSSILEAHTTVRFIPGPRCRSMLRFRVGLARSDGHIHDPEVGGKRSVWG